MAHSPDQTSASEQFINRWKASGASERANYQLFLTELCDFLDVEKPRPASDKVHEADYTFERPVDFNDGDGKKTTNFIDLYKKNCFVLEAKQGSDKNHISEAELLGGEKVKTKTGTAKRETRTWDREMKKAKEQALRYARSLPTSEGWPPFLIVVDVGFCIDLYSDFARQGKNYIPFPDPINYRISLTDLGKTEIQQRLKLLFTKPLELDPSKHAAKVTRELAERLAKLASLLEQSGHTPEKVAGFLMRCLFTMFAEDVKLLPEQSFTRLLQDYTANISLLPQALKSLWFSMDKGGFEPALRTTIPQFNGFLFKDQEALPLTAAQLDLLIQAAKANWAYVEPAIFGTLLERALQPRDRHKLGAHYTPRAYVERLVMPTIIEPLREEWEAARTASAILEEKGDEAGAFDEINKFHRRLCTIKVLDPACGSGNFLYVTLEHLKRLEGEVTEYMAKFPRQLGLDMTGGYTVTPEQLIGLEVNPRAAAIADVVLWIGYLQWHFRTHGNAKRLTDPILRQYGNIRLQDAVLIYVEKKQRLNSNGNPVTRWDGFSTKPHSITGLEVPDESAQISTFDYTEPKSGSWPEANFIVGNPPFIGKLKMREALGDGYVEALRKAYSGVVPDSADFVMYWWNKAAKLLEAGEIEQFGFITTNSIAMTFNRRVIQDFLDSKIPISIVYAIPDHPWVDSSDGAAVRIAITVARKGNYKGVVNQVISETETGRLEKEVEFDEKTGKIHSDLSIGANVSSAVSLKANQSVSSFGMMLAGSGFIVSPEKAYELGLGKIPELTARIRPYRNGKDLTSNPRGVMLIDMFPLSEEQVRNQFPEVYQHLVLSVKPGRDQNRDKAMRENWWLFGRNRQDLRAALNGLRRYISTPETAKHRFFISQDISILPDHKLANIALEDFFDLGVLSSNIHVYWAMAAGGRLGVGNDSVYNTTRCFQTFPFPDATESQKDQIRLLASQIDSHRKNRQDLHPSLTITDMYNVMEKLKIGEKLNPKEQTVHERGLVSLLLQLHTELDTIVAKAYGWPNTLSQDEILQRLVDLNKERANEEASGFVRWLRPDYQNPLGASQSGITLASVPNASKKAELAQWPKNLADQAKVIQRVIQNYSRPFSPREVNQQFKKVKNPAFEKREKEIGNLLETISELGLLRKTEEGLFVK